MAIDKSVVSLFRATTPTFRYSNRRLGQKSWFCSSSFELILIIVRLKCHKRSGVLIHLALASWPAPVNDLPG